MQNIEDKSYKCSKCKKPSLFQCSGCHQEVYCSEQCQQSDWVKHKVVCLQEKNKEMIPNEKEVEVEVEFKRKSTSPKKEKAILLPIPPFPFIKKLSGILFIRNIKNQIQECYSLALEHRIYFHEYLLTNPFKIFIEYTSSLFNKYKACLHYIENFIMLIRLYMKDNNTQMAEQTLTILTKELFDDQLGHTLSIIFKKFSKTLSIKNTSIKLQNLQFGRQLFTSYLTCISFLLKVSKQLKMNKLYSKYLMKYMVVYHHSMQSLNQSKEKQCSILKSHIYFIYGCLYSKDTQLDIALKFFNQSAQNEYKDPQLTKIVQSSFFNQSAIYFSMDKMKEAKEKALASLEIKLKQLDEHNINDEQLRLIYLILAEIEIDNQNYNDALKYLDDALNTIPTDATNDEDLTKKKDELFNSITRSIKKKDSIIHDFDLFTKKRKHDLLNKLLIALKEKTIYQIDHQIDNNQEQYERILSYLSQEMRKKKEAIDKEFDVSDIENFFLFMTKLSLHQIDIVNRTQSKKICANLPILFSKEFKNSLNPAQRSHFDKLKTLSLIRSKVLKDINGKIEIENLKYDIIKVRNNYSIQKLQDNFFSEIYPKLRQKRVNTQRNSRFKKLLSPSKKDKRNSTPFIHGKEYNISKIKLALKTFLNSGEHFYQDDAVEQIKEFATTNYFYILLNEMSLNDIKELEKEPEILCELISDYIKQMESEKNSEEYQMNTIDKVDTEINNLIKYEDEEKGDSEEDDIHCQLAITLRDKKNKEKLKQSRSECVEEDDNLYASKLIIEDEENDDCEYIPI